MEMAEVQPSSLCLHKLSNHFKSLLTLPLPITEQFLSACYCNPSPCFCSWILSSSFWVTSGWLQWSFSSGSCHSQSSPGWQIKQTGLRRNSRPFPLPSVPDSSPWPISTERIFMNTFFIFNHVLDLTCVGNTSKIQSEKKCSLWRTFLCISLVHELCILCFPSP